MGLIKLLIILSTHILFLHTQKSKLQFTALDSTTVGTAQTSDLYGNFTTLLPLVTSDIDTEGNSTELPNDVTTLKATPGNDTKKKQSTNRRKTPGNIDSCSCDLQLNFCDINCCCDEDCSQDDKEIFDHCQVEDRLYDTRYCEYMKYIYINNTPFEWQINQNGLFCVVKSNLAPFYLVQRKRALKTFTEAESEKTELFSWKKCTTPGHNDILNSFKKFVYGNDVLVIRKKELSKLQLPNRFITNRCLIKDDVINLKNVVNTCIQDVIDGENRYLSMKEYFEDTFVIASPDSFNFTKYSKNSFQDCPRNVCLSIMPNICNEYLKNCVNVAKNDTRIEARCNIQKKSCVNVVKKIQYDFYHNGTNGFIEVVLLVHLENVTTNFWRKDVEYSQEFSVNFWWINQTRNYSEILSGNPGYLVSKPILIGKLFNMGNKTQEQLIMKRNSSRFTDNFLTIPENDGGYCKSDENTHTVVEFGFDLLTKCKYREYITREKAIINGSKLCRNIQRSVFNLWDLREEENLTFGSFGNANVTLSYDWLKILYKKDPRLILNDTFGTYDLKSNLLSCFGIATCLDIDLFHSKIDVGSLHNQEKLLAVTYSFGSFVNKTFFINKNSNFVAFELDLQSRVTFYDISRPKVKKMLDPPSLDIKLPYDFFYPFVKIDNGVENLTPSFINLISIVVVLISINH